MDDKVVNDDDTVKHLNQPEQITIKRHR
jgi:hypothetical protein